MKNGVRTTFALMFLAGWFSACASPVIQYTPTVQSTPTIALPEEAVIVFKDGTCEYTGPEVLPYGQLSYSWRVEETKAQFRGDHLQPGGGKPCKISWIGMLPTKCCLPDGSSTW